jgi:L-rhamnose-H+ transport protein
MLGLAVASVGLAVSTGIILGCSVALGSLIPLLFLGSERLFSPEAAKIIGADLVILMGVLLCARAGYLRDRRAAADESGWSLRRSGLLLCFVAGALTPLLNVALASGTPITAIAIQHGAAPNSATNAVWELAVSAGSLPSIIYCALLLNKNKTWATFSQSRGASNAILCVLMAVFFITSTIGYGIGAVNMGTLGPVIGWPVYVSSILLGNNFWGWCTGEWRYASRRATLAMIAGIIVQVTGIVLLCMIDLPTAT